MRYICLILLLCLAGPVAAAAAGLPAAPGALPGNVSPPVTAVSPVHGTARSAVTLSPGAEGTAAPCPSGRECLTLAEAEAAYLPGWWHGDTVCGFAVAGNRSVPAYCCNGTRKPAAAILAVPAAETLPMDVRVSPFSTPAVPPSTNSTAVTSGSVARRVPAINPEEGFVDSFVGFFTGIFTRPDCPPSLRACGKKCVDLTTDPANCGLCGSACPAGAVCSGGECLVYGPA